MSLKDVVADRFYHSLSQEQMGDLGELLGLDINKSVSEILDNLTNLEVADEARERIFKNAYNEAIDDAEEELQMLRK